MDKILLGLFLSTLAGFITAIVSVVKLVNEKENKTSEFRQAWTNSIREAVADLAGKLTTMTASIEYQSRLSDISNKLEKRNSPISEKRLEMVRANLLRVGEDISAARHDQYQAYATCKLHFKPDDPDFKPFEEKFDSIVSACDSILASKEHAERQRIKKENYGLIQDLIEVSRGILKKEWERVKKGEPIYIKTKSFSLYGGGLMLLSLVVIGLYGLSVANEKLASHSPPKMEIASATKPDICWSLQGFGRRIFKINSCTGEVVELTGRSSNAKSPSN